MISGKSANLRSEANEGRHIGLIRHTSDSQFHSFAFECAKCLRRVIQRDGVGPGLLAWRDVGLTIKGR